MKATYRLQVAEAVAKIDLDEAKKRFEEFDRDKSGFLEEAEIAQVAKWVFGSLKPNEKELLPEQIEAETKRLMKELDADQDKKVSFAEFEAYFVKEAANTEKIKVAKQSMPNVDAQSGPIPFPIVHTAESLASLQAGEQAAQELSTTLCSIVVPPVGSRILQGVKRKFYESGKLATVKSDVVGTIAEWVIGELSDPMADEELIQKDAESFKGACAALGEDLSWLSFSSLYNATVSALLKNRASVSAESKKLDLEEVEKAFKGLGEDGLGEAEATKFLEWCVGQIGLDGNAAVTEVSRFEMMVAKDCDGGLRLEEMEIFVEELQEQELAMKARLMAHRVETASNITMNISPDLDSLEETLKDARKRWDQFDVDGNGTLEGVELNAFITFVLESVAHEGTSPTEVEADITQIHNLIMGIDVENTKAEGSKATSKGKKSSASDTGGSARSTRNERDENGEAADGRRIVDSDDAAGSSGATPGGSSFRGNAGAGSASQSQYADGTGSGAHATGSDSGSGAGSGSGSGSSGTRDQPGDSGMLTSDPFGAFEPTTQQRRGSYNTGSSVQQPRRASVDVTRNAASGAHLALIISHPL